MERIWSIEALRESGERLRFMAESMPQKIFTASAAGELDYVNRQWLEFTGLSPAQLLGRNWADCLHPEDRPEYVRLWNECIAEGSPFEIEHRIRRTDGAYRWHLTRARAMRNASGHTNVWIGSTTEIHRQKETEADLRRLNEDLNHFAFAASHDLQEPLRMICCYSDLLLQCHKGDIGETSEMCARYIREGTARMRMLLSDLLSYTRVTQDDGTPCATVDLDRAFASACSNLEPVFEETGASVECGALPVVSGREVHFVQLFQNLLGNALKYRSDAPPRIRVTAERIGTEWRIGVIDNGIGIAPEYRRQIFGVFKRLHGKNIPGTGIGLSICQRVVERHGGRIWVADSDSGSGSAFYFTLPAV